MDKNVDKKMSRVLLVLAIASFIITFMEGCYFYSAEEYQNPLFRGMLIIQNSIKAYGFKASISLEAVMKSLPNAATKLEYVVGYAYCFAVFVAPYCTLVVVYKCLEKLMHIKGWHIWHLNRKHIIVFGYNEEVKALLFNNHMPEDSKSNSATSKGSIKKEKRKIHVVSAKISQQDEHELLRKGIEVHKVDCLIIPDRKLKYHLKLMEVNRADVIILYEEQSSRNFALYYMFHSRGENLDIELKENVKFFCRCEDGAVKRLLENYYDTEVLSNTKTQKSDLEVISTYELNVRKMLQKNPLHSYYLTTKEKQNPNEWDLHLLIVGFGKMGQQIMVQAMNMGVVGSHNSILVDVVDFKMQDRKSVFANIFDDEYVVINDNEFIIPSDRAEGEFRVRFHNTNVQYNEFQQILRECGDTEKDGIFTYIAVCIEDTEINLHCVTEIERYMKKYAQDVADAVKIGVRMETNRQMGNYLKQEESNYKNVFVMEDSISVLTLDDLLDEKVDEEAKSFNHLYSTMTIQNDQEEYNASATSKKDKLEAWMELNLFRRNSNRALAYHSSVLKDVFDAHYSICGDELAILVGKNGSVLKEVEDGKRWVYSGSVDDFVLKQSSRSMYPLISEMSRMEHRRWCYFMASCGWKRTDDPTAKKNDKRRENPCMCSWDELTIYQKNNCQYDLMPLLLIYKERKEKK